MDREAWQATRYSPCGRKELDTTEHTRKGGKKEQMELADLNIPKLHIIILKSGFPTQGLKKKTIKKSQVRKKDIRPCLDQISHQCHKTWLTCDTGPGLSC